MIYESQLKPRARRRDTNEKRILEAAMELVIDGGLDALSIQKLAAAVDYTPGALYRYFDSKDAILAQLVLRILGELRGYLEAALAELPTAPQAPLTRILTLTEGYRAFARNHPRKFGLLVMTLADPRVLLDKAKDADPVALEMIASLQALAEALDAGAALGMLKPGDEAARTVCLFGLLQGLSLMQKQARYAPALLDIDQLAREGIRALLIGWGAEATQVDQASSYIQAHVGLCGHFGAPS